MAEKPEVPDGWHWSISNRSSHYYTHWLYTDHVEGGYEAQVYWDKGGRGYHYVNFYEILGVRDDGDPNVSDYPCKSAKFESEEAALQYAAETAEELTDET